MHTYMWMYHSSQSVLFHVKFKPMTHSTLDRYFKHLVWLAER